MQNLFRKLKVIGCCLLLLVLGLATYGQKKPGAPTAGDIIFYFQLAHPDKWLANIDAFLESSQLAPLLAPFMEHKKCKELLLSRLEQQGQKVRADYFDWTKPVGLALLVPPEEPFAADKLVVVGFFGLGKEKNAFRQLSSLLGGEKTFLKQHKDSILISNSPTFPDSAAAADILKLTALKPLKRYEPGSLSFYFNFRRVLAMEEFKPEKWKAELSKEWESDSPFRGLDALLGLADRFMQLEEVYSNFTADSRGVSFELDSYWQKDKSVAVSLAGLPQPRKTKEFARYIPVAALCSGISNGEPAKLLAAFGFDMHNLFSSLPVDKTAIEEWASWLDSAARCLGPRTAFSFDIDWDPTLFESGAQADENSYRQMLDILAQSLDIRLISVCEVKDSREYRQLVQKLVAGGTLQKMLAPWLAGFSVTLEPEYRTGEQTDGFSYDSITCRFALDTAASGAKDRQSQARLGQLLAVLSGKLKLYLSYQPDRAYWVMAQDGAALLKNLVKKDAIPGLSLADSATARKIWEGIPDDSQLITQYSLSRLLRLVSRFSRGQIPYYNPLDAPGILGYLRVKSPAVEQGWAWSSRELADMLAQIGQKLLETITRSAGAEKI